MGLHEIPESEANLDLINNYYSLGIIICLVVNRNTPGLLNASPLN